MSFWYGLSFADISEMPMAAIEAYMNRLEIRKTEVRLMLADVTMLPNMKKNDRVSIVNNWMKLLEITNQAKAIPASPGRLKMMGIGVRHV